MSQCARILAFLSDGNPHRMEDIHRAVGFCRLNSRMSELRARGHRIECEKRAGTYTYRLLVSPETEQPRLTDSGETSSRTEAAA